MAGDNKIWRVGHEWLRGAEMSGQRTSGSDSTVESLKTLLDLTPVQDIGLNFCIHVALLLALTLGLLIKYEST